MSKDSGSVTRWARRKRASGTRRCATCLPRRRNRCSAGPLPAFPTANPNLSKPIFGRSRTLLSKFGAARWWVSSDATARARARCSRFSRASPTRRKARCVCAAGWLLCWKSARAFTPNSRAGKTSSSTARSSECTAQRSKPSSTRSSRSQRWSGFWTRPSNVTASGAGDSRRG